MATSSALDDDTGGRGHGGLSAPIGSVGWLYQRLGFVSDLQTGLEVRAAGQIQASWADH